MFTPLHLVLTNRDDPDIVCTRRKVKTVDTNLLDLVDPEVVSTAELLETLEN